MTRTKLYLALFLAVVTSSALIGCDNASRLTEQEHIQRAKDFEDEGNLQGSIVELKNALQKNPNSPQARLLIGQVYLKRGMGAEAEKELNLATKLGVSRESVLPQLGEALILMGEYARVLTEIQPDKQTLPTNRARILQLRADAFVMQGQPGAACPLYAQSLDIATNNPATYWGLAQCALSEGDHSKARGLVMKALELPNKRSQTWSILGHLEQLEKNTPAALAAYSNALKADPANLGALQSRATLYIRHDNTTAAQTDVDTIRKRHPNSLAANYLTALLHFKEKKYSQAREALQKALSIAPDHLPSLVLAGLTESALGNLRTAESHLNRAIRRAPNNHVVLQILAATQLRMGHTDDAQKTLASINLAKTRDAGLYTVAARIALARNDYTEAATHYERAAEISPDNAAIRTDLGLARLAIDDKRAMADLQAAADLETDNTRADNAIILRLIKQRRFDSALEAIAALQKKTPNSPIPWQYRGVAYLGKNDSGQARSSFEQALRLDAGFFPSTISLAELDRAEGKLKDARARFEKILAANPRHLQAMLMLADVSLSENKEEEYFKWLNRAIKAQPRALPPRVELTRYYVAKGDNAKALAAARDALNADPNSSAMLNLLGATQISAGQFANAVETFRRLAIATQSPDAFQRLAEAQIAGKHIDDARASLEKALQLRSDHLGSLDVLMKLELSQNHPDAALGIARRLQERQPRSPVGFDREGDIYVSQKRFPQAVTAYRQALNNGAGTSGLIKLHRVLSESGNASSASQLLQEWIKQHPDDLAARSYAANAYLLSQRYKEAVEQYQILVQAKPSDYVLLNNLANAYLNVSDPRALEIAEKALQRAPDHPGVLDTMGWILVVEGKFDRALPYLQKAVKKAPENASLRYHYGVALARTGRTGEARKELDAALANKQAFPDRERARALRQQL